MEELSRRRQEEEQDLKEVREALRSSNEEFQQLSTKIHSARDRYRYEGVTSRHRERE